MNNHFSMYVKGLALSAALCVMTAVPLNVLATNINNENPTAPVENNVNNNNNANNNLEAVALNVAGSNAPATSAPLKISDSSTGNDEEWGDSDNTESRSRKKKLWWRTLGISALVIGASFALYHIFNDSAGPRTVPTVPTAPVGNML